METWTAGITRTLFRGCRRRDGGTGGIADIGWNLSNFDKYHKHLEEEWKEADTSAEGKLNEAVEDFEGKINNDNKSKDRFDEYVELWEQMVVIIAKLDLE